MNVLRIVLLLCLGLLITTSTALAGKCKPVSANVGAVVNYYGAADCPPQSWDYDTCVLAPTNGTLNGDWWFYFYGWNAVEVYDPQAGHPGFWAGWSFSSFLTNKGELWTRDSWIIDFDYLVTSGGFNFYTQTSEIIGGTGVYEGATGRFGFIGNEVAGIFRGEVCTQ